LLRGQGPERGRIVIQSFSRASLDLVRSLDPDLPRVQLVEDDIDATTLVRMLRDIARWAQGVGPHRRSVDARVVAAAHDAGLVVHPYTVDDPIEMRALVGAGVDGMFTNVPDTLREVLTRAYE
jgi:glycerophosphoryl diester phosphodiesterase